jgi:hypothetical protein
MHRKKRLATVPSPAGMSLTKLSLGGNNLIFPAQREFVSDIPARDRMSPTFLREWSKGEGKGKVKSRR